MKKIKFLLLVMVQFFSAQVNIGVKNDHFISTNALTQNPSVFLLNPNPWEVNILSADVFLQNNYAFIADQSVMGLVRGNNKIYDNKSANQENLPKNTLGYQDSKTFNEYFQTDVIGPAFAVQFSWKGRPYAAGFYSRLRTIGSGFGLNNQYKYPNFVDQSSFSRYYQPFELSYATLQENAVFLSTSLFREAKSEGLAGITLKQSKIWDAFIIRSNQVFQLDYDRSSNNLAFSNYDIDVLAPTSYDYNQKKYNPKAQGTSYAADLGFTYVDYGDYEKENGEYLQKIALSLTDVGFIRVEGEAHRFISNPFVINKGQRFNNLNNFFNLMREFSVYVYDNETSSLEDTSFQVALPTALHLSYSGNLSNNRYLTVGLTQRVPLAKNAFKTANLVFVNWAQSKANFSYAAQLSMFEYKNLQLGGYLRWGPFFVGSDHILPVLFSQKKLDSFDFYFGFKIYPFWSNAMKRRAQQDCNCH